MRRRQFLTLSAAAAAGLVAPVAAPRIARAQAYPARPVRLVIPFPPGGAFDAVGRPLVDKMKSILGTMVIENIGGGGASIGAAAVAILFRAYGDEGSNYALMLAALLAVAGAGLSLLRLAPDSASTPERS